MARKKKTKIQGPIETVYTDGSCITQTKRGGYASFNERTGELMYGSIEDTTPARAELHAVLRAIENRPSGKRFHIVSDSQYVVGLINSWINTWSEEKLKKAKNLDLVTELKTHMSKNTITAEWVKGHAKHPRNELCDKVARMMAKG